MTQIYRPTALCLCGHRQNQHNPLSCNKCNCPKFIFWKIAARDDPALLDNWIKIPILKCHVDDFKNHKGWWACFSDPLIGIGDFVCFELGFPYQIENIYAIIDGIKRDNPKFPSWYTLSYREVDYEYGLQLMKEKMDAETGTREGASGILSP